MAPSARGVLPTASISIVLIALFVAAGFFTHGYVLTAATTSERLYTVRNDAARALKLQLDEETGIRGYAATRDRSFLDPYRAAARGRLESAFSRLGSDLATSRLAAAEPALADARATSARWNREVAAPTIAHPSQGAHRVEKRGKELMDDFRRDLDSIDGLLERRESLVSEELRAAIDRITVLVIVAGIVSSIVALLYARQQVRAAERIAAGERQAEAERRERALLQGAYEAEKHIADSLQTAFSQRPLPSLETLRFSASYVPATEETRLGGDWYDVLALHGDRVLFTIGDVTGHGIDAAVTMNRARQSFVSAALLDVDPGSVLARVNADMVAREDRLVTAVAGVADPATYEFVYAIAGHPPPVLAEPGRPPRFLECGSLPLGGIPEAQYSTRRLQSMPGATLVLYTDGAVEHSRDVIAGEALLLEAVEHAAEHPEVEAAAWIHREIFQGRSVGDDVAILTIGFSAEPTLGLVVSADSGRARLSGRVAPAGSDGTGDKAGPRGFALPRGLAS